MPASVVDLPDPVGPVTTTRPLVRKHRSSTACGSPSFSAGMMSIGIWRMTEPTPLRSSKAFTRKRARPGTSYAKSASRFSSKSALAFSFMIGASRRITSSEESAERSRMKCISPWMRITG